MPEASTESSDGANPHSRSCCFISLTYALTCSKAHYNEENANVEGLP